MNTLPQRQPYPRYSKGVVYLLINGLPLASTFEASLITWRHKARFNPIHSHHVLTGGMTLASSSRIGGDEAASPDGQHHKVARAGTSGELPSW